MKKTLAMMAIVLTVGMTAALDAEARRLGGGKSAGMQRQNVTQPANNAPGSPGAPAQVAPAAGGAAAAAAPAAAAAKRSWMGPVAGLAAGLGIAALASHFGFGEALANMLTIALVVMAVMVAIGFFLRKRAAAQAGAMAGAGGVGPLGGMQRRAEPQATPFGRNDDAPQARGGSLIGSRLMGGAGAGTAAGASSAGTIPAGFDTAGFERTARDQFMALQAANDARDLDRLRDYLSPEMFEAVRGEIAERGDAAQKTEVFGLQTQVIDVAEEADQYVVSVRFTGSVREQPGAVPEDLHEVWHLAKPKAGFGGWVIAGIQQVA